MIVDETRTHEQQQQQQHQQQQQTQTHSTEANKTTEYKQNRRTYLPTYLCTYKITS